MRKDTTRPTKAYVLVAIALVLTLLPLVTRPSIADALSDFDEEVVALINEHRVSKGLSELVEWVPLSSASLAWSQNMRGSSQPCGGGNFAHDSAYNISRDGMPPGATNWGENIAYACGFAGSANNPGFTYGQLPAKCQGNIDFTTPLMTFCQWIDSTPHRQAIETAGFTHIGVGTASSWGGGSVARWSTARFATAPVSNTCNGLTATVDLNTGAGSPTNGDDVIVGTSGPDTINGLGGDDTICGRGGDDIISGNAGNDVIFGEGGDDTIYGGEGNDTIRGGDGKDRVRGQNGNDDIAGGNGNDNLNGNNGNDVVKGDAGHDYVSGRDGVDVVDGGSGSDTVNGGGKQDTVYGGSGNDVMNGNAMDDTMYGGDGHDVMSGGDGDDHIEGQQGDDDIKGNRNDDTMWGGSGTDTCDGMTGTDTQVNCETVISVP